MNFLSEGLTGRRENQRKKATQSSSSTPMSIVPALVLIDKSRSPPRYFDRGELLGTGGFAKVYRVTERGSGISFADKVINKDIFERRSNAREKVDREIQLHRKMDHVNIIKFWEFFEDSSFVHIILELAPQATLLNVSKNRGTVTEPEAKYYFRQMAAGTRYIHNQKILHRDLKLGNMFLSEHMEVKIGDFGLSIGFSENKPSLCGTPNYVSPEIIAKKGHSMASEVWSLGCIVYALLCGKPPFDSESVEATYKLISNCEFSIPGHLSSRASEFLIGILISDPSRRGTLEEPIRNGNYQNSLLAHPFMRSGFVPTFLPSSAVHQPPDLSSHFSEIIQIDQEDHGNLDQGCSPGFRSSLRRMKGFFNQRDDFLEQTLISVNQFLTRCSEDQGNILESTICHSSHQIPVFVSKWVDYTNRFGFVYKLSDGSIGVLFNDTTKLGIHIGGFVEFTDKRGKYLSFGKDENCNSYMLPELRSRIEKLDAYIKYMDEYLNDTVIEDEVLEIVSTGHKTKVPQLKRWHRTSTSIGMEFSSNLIQINFKEEHVKILVWMLENDMFLTTIYESKSRTYSLHSSAHFVVPAAVRNVLGQVDTKVKELLAIQIRD